MDHQATSAQLNESNNKMLTDELTDELWESTESNETKELVNKIEYLMLMDDEERTEIIDEFVKNRYFESCEFETAIDTIVFHLLNYALTLNDLIDEKLVELFRQLFAHSEHCFFSKNHLEHGCKISSKLFRSSWLRVYFESTAKIYNYNFNSMNDQLLNLIEILLQKTSNRMSINTQFVPLLNLLIRNSQGDLIAKEKKTKKVNIIPVQKKKKVVLLIILILDGQYQSYLSKSVMKEAATFLDHSGMLEFALKQIIIIISPTSPNSFGI